MNFEKRVVRNFTIRNTSILNSIKIIDPDRDEGWQIDSSGTGNYTLMGLGCLASESSNSTLGDLINPDLINEINLKRAMNNRDGNELEVRIEGVETGLDVIGRVDLEYGELTGDASRVTEDYVWMNESSWGGENACIQKDILMQL